MCFSEEVQVSLIVLRRHLEHQNQSSQHDRPWTRVSAASIINDITSIIIVITTIIIIITNLRQILKVTKLLSSPAKTIPVDLGDHSRNEVLVELDLTHLHKNTCITSVLKAHLMEKNTHHNF